MESLLELKRFAKIALAPGEEKTVTFTLGRDQLQFVDQSLGRIVEPGRFMIYVGGDPTALLTAELIVERSMKNN
ncbi:hypothetical protein GC102_36815 [Paenibacillus sp. LMG 31460]|uniref:Fibronectin type III-like domain-containing protein n=1 Tax=Paenibacillus germinis TaxID=2654979 RepID=A0ABX1ZH61_9BACL|nr:hypothetical protein [Paenibacillus germinis]